MISPADGQPLPANGRAAKSARPAGIGEEIAKVWPYYALLVLLTLAMFTPAIQAGFVLKDHGIGSAQIMGTVVAASSIVAIFSAWSFGWLRSWIGLHGFLAIDALSMGAGIAIIGLAHDVSTIFVGCACVGIGAGMSEPAIASIIFGRAAPKAHVMAMGLIVSALNTGQFINPLLFDPLRRLWGSGGAFVALGMTLIAVSCLVAASNRHDLLNKE